MSGMLSSDALGRGEPTVPSLSCRNRLPGEEKRQFICCRAEQMSGGVYEPITSDDQYARF